jgi:phospholipid transport system substrate-binding protein
MDYSIMLKTNYLKQIKILFTLLLAFQLNYVIAATADDIVYETTQEILTRLEIDKERLAAEPEYIQVIVSELIVPHMDFETMSALALADSWNQLSAAEQGCFSLAFKNLLVERYAYILLSYRNQDIHYQSAEPIGEKDYVSIRQTLTRPEVEPLTLEYPMRPDGGTWKVVDLVVDGVSLLRNYRKMFNKEIKQKGFEEFTADFMECHP